MGLIDGLFGAFTDMVSTGATNAMNYEMWQTQNEIQQRENEIMREREDNAIVRRMNDLSNAGINPLLAGNIGGASAMAGNVMPAIQMQKSNAGNIIANIAESEARTKATKAGQKLTEEQAKETAERTRIMIESAPTKEQAEKANKYIEKMNDYDLYRASIIHNELKNQIEQTNWNYLNEGQKADYKALLKIKEQRKLNPQEAKRYQDYQTLGLKQMSAKKANIQKLQDEITTRGLNFTLDNMTLKNYINLISDILGVSAEAVSPILKTAMILK